MNKITSFGIFVLFAAVISLLPNGVQAQQNVEDSSTDYCVRFTNLNEFPDYIFFFDGVLEWNRKLITSYDCVSFAVNTEPRLLAVPIESYIRGDVEANINSPAAVVVNFTFVHPATSPDGGSDSGSNTTGGNTTGSSGTTTGDSESGSTDGSTGGDSGSDSGSTTGGGTDEGEAQISFPNPESTENPRLENIPEVAPEYRGVSIQDSIELSFDEEKNEFDGVPVFVTYKKRDGSGATETLEFGADGARPTPTLNNVNYLPYIIAGAVILAVIVVVFVYYRKLRAQRAIAKSKPKRSQNQKRRSKKVSSK